MFSPRAASDWFGSSESGSSRPSTASSYRTAKSASTVSAATQPQQPPPHRAAPAVPSAVDVLPSLLADLNNQTTPAAVGESAMHLCLLLDSAVGEEAAALGAALLASGSTGLARIVTLLDDPSREASVHQSCLLLAANLAAPDIDPEGRIAAELKRLGALQRMITHVTSSSSVLTVAYALGAIRNNANTADEVGLLSSSGTLAIIQALANGDRAEEDPEGRLRQFAAGCLVNARQIMASAGSSSTAPQVEW